MGLIGNPHPGAARRVLAGSNFLSVERNAAVIGKDDDAAKYEKLADQLRDCGLSFSPWRHTGGQEEAMVEAVRRCSTAPD